jgi:hypothetical protein
MIASSTSHYHVRLLASFGTVFEESCQIINLNAGLRRNTSSTLCHRCLPKNSESRGAESEACRGEESASLRTVNFQLSYIRGAQDVTCESAHSDSHVEEGMRKTNFGDQVQAVRSLEAERTISRSLLAARVHGLAWRGSCTSGLTSLS